MSDDERLARLTEMARRVYGEQAVLEPVWQRSCGLSSQRSEGGFWVRRDGLVCLQAMGARCIDALEAALLAMLCSTEQGGVLAAVAGRMLYLERMIEELAADWERKADALLRYDARYKQALRRCAAEARERVKAGGDRG